VNFAQQARELADGCGDAAVWNGEREEPNTRIGAQSRFGLKFKLSDFSSFEQ
jgi:hypothetical protein